MSVDGATLDASDRYRREQRSARRERSVKPDKMDIARSEGAFAEIRFSVCDTEGSPISGADITAEAKCHDDGKPVYVKAVTDTNGCATASGIWSDYVNYYVKRDGFYETHGYFAFKKLSDDGQRWIRDTVTEVKLRREVEPHPMLKRTVRMEDLPSQNCRVGYDVLKGDFTPPHGIGEVADFKMLFYHADVQRFPFGSGTRSLRLAVVPGDATRGFTVINSVKDSFGGPISAPEKYGSKSFSFSFANTKRNGYMWSEKTQKIQDRFYLFEARGRSGVLAFDNFNLPLLSPNGNFAMQFRVNENPGEKSLVTTAGPRNRDDGKRPGEADGEDAAPAAAPAGESDNLLLAATGPHSAIFFGMKGGDGFIPAAFADRKLASMDGVRFLKIDDSVGKIPDGAFEGSKDLVSVELRQYSPMEIGSRAFASCPNLSLVYSRELKEFDICDDSFDGASPGLSCILPGNRGDTFSIRTNVAPLSRLFSYTPMRSGELTIQDDFLCRVEGERVYVEKYIGKPADIVFLPEKAAGMRTTGMGDDLFRDGIKARVVVVPERVVEYIEHGERIEFHASDAPDILITHSRPVPCRCNGKRPKMCVIGPVHGGRYGVDDSIILPPGTDPRDIAAGALVETNGFTAIKRDGAAVLIHFGGGGADRIEVPAEIGGLPVVELGPHLFAGRDTREFVLPPTLRKIGFCAFAGLKECRSISVPEGVEEIDAGAFFACLKLKSLSLPSTLRQVGYGAFEAMPAAPVVPKGATVDTPREFSSAK